ncbi:hypothetical protein [Salinimicrobium flavum]|uniref:Lipoprotein n=1 Tax=Salinimicrobium flavum TaxID=1737065 RepID=A0ABW5IWV8_9FLAO
MKIFLKTIPALLVLFSFSNCANGKKLQEEPPLAIKEAYYTSWVGGVKGAGSGINLYIPAEEDAEISLDSVYFRGRKAVLEKDPAEPGLYVATFKIRSDEGKAADIIMHRDPKKEYGNKPPVILEKIPFELEQDEAVVRYTRNGKEKYFRITGIKKKETGEVILKNPQNIQH